MTGLVAEGAKHHRTVWRGEKPWHWAAIWSGRVQPLGYRNYYRRGRRQWQLHVTPVHLMRDGSKWAVGLCLGSRTVLLYRHI